MFELVLLAFLAAATPAGGGGPAATPAPKPAVVLDVPAANVPQAALAADLPATVRVHVEIGADGLVTATHVLPGADAALSAAAAAAARWAVFEPATGPGGQRTEGEATLGIVFPALPDAEPLPPQRDRVGQGELAAAAHDTVDAIAWYVGALGEVGRQPTLREPWSLRERIIELHRDQPTLVHSGIRTTVATVASELVRSVGREAHRQWAGRVDESLAEVPWYAPLLRWRAVIAAGSDERADALRWTRLYALAAADSADHVRAERGLALLAQNRLVEATALLRR